MTYAIRHNAPSKKVMNTIRRAFRADDLKRICESNDFRSYGKRVDLAPAEDGHDRFYYYADNGASVLAVAHLDHVQGDGTAQIVETNAGLLVTSGALDDRLGAYVILELLPRLGVTCDWLLTTDEEIGRSTASDFVTEKDYNWIIEFDRGGTDVVMYDYETDELCELVEASGARVGKGSYSDICYLEHLECSAFNWGVGYQDYHGPRSHAWLEDTFRMVARFLKFYRANKDEYLPYEPVQNYFGWDDLADSWAKHDDNDGWEPTGDNVADAERLYEWLRNRAQ